MNIMTYLKQPVNFEGHFMVQFPKLQETNGTVDLQQLVNQYEMMNRTVDQLKEALAVLKTAVSTYEVLDDESDDYMHPEEVKVGGTS